MITRLRHLDRLAWLFRTFPVVAILGVRQVCKTTLARAFAQGWGGPVTHFDLEGPADLAGSPIRRSSSRRFAGW